MDMNKYNKWISNLFAKLPFSQPFDFTEKESNIFAHTAYMLDRTQSMFEYKGLPDTIPQRVLELYLQINGNCCFTKYKGEYYVFTGGLGGEPDEYYRPTIYTIANPALNYTANLKIHAECVGVPNDAMFLGLMPIFNRYESQLAENELSINIAIVNSRIIDLISASDDSTKASAELFLENIKKGKNGVIGENAFLEGIRAQPYGTSGMGNAITQLIEAEQYLKASLFNELGLDANYNMKRESLSIAESQMNNDALLPLVDNMLKSRRDALEKINEMYGLDISVDYASSWKDNVEELEIAHEQEESEATEEQETPEANEDPETPTETEEPESQEEEEDKENEDAE